MEPAKIPEEFPFPFPPYPIQVDLMKSVYEIFEYGKVGILESPTGTVRLFTMSI
jgi:chromosome transmission fidelity protein 1